MRYFILISLFLTSLSFGQFQKGDWTLSIGGGGSTGNDASSTTLGAVANLGYFVTDTVELSLNQSIAYSDTQNAAWIMSTGVSADYNFNNFDRFVPFIGAEIGQSYGNISGTTQAGPEAGLKFFITSTVFLEGKAIYVIPLNDTNNGFLNYTLQLGVRL